MCCDVDGDGRYQNDHGIEAVVSERVVMVMVDIRTEAVMQALALNKKQSVIPMPSKRTSAAYSQNIDTPADHVSGENICLQRQIDIDSLTFHAAHVPVYLDLHKQLFYIVHK